MAIDPKITNFYDVSGPSFPNTGFPKDANGRRIKADTAQEVFQFNNPAGPSQMKLWENGIEGNPNSTISGMSIRCVPIDHRKQAMIGLVHCLPHKQPMQYYDMPSKNNEWTGILTLPLDPEYYKHTDPENFLVWKKLDGKESSYDEQWEYSPMAVRVGEGVSIGAVGYNCQITLSVRYYGQWNQTVKIFPGGDWDRFGDFLKASKADLVSIARHEGMALEDQFGNVIKDTKRAMQSAAFGAMAKTFMTTDARKERETQVECALDGFFFSFGLDRFPSRFWAKNWVSVQAFEFADGEYLRTNKKNIKFRHIEEFSGVHYTSNKKKATRRKKKSTTKAERDAAKRKKEETKRLSKEFKKKLLERLSGVPGILDLNLDDPNAALRMADGMAAARRKTESDPFQGVHVRPGRIADAMGVHPRVQAAGRQVPAGRYRRQQNPPQQYFQPPQMDQGPYVPPPLARIPPQVQAHYRPPLQQQGQQAAEEEDEEAALVAEAAEAAAVWGGAGGRPKIPGADRDRAREFAADDNLQ